MIRAKVFLGCFAVLCCVFVRGIGAHADWPQFRGPDGQGHAAAKNLPVEWSPEKNVVWKQAIAGQGWSSPVVLGDRIFVSAAVPAEGDAGDYSLRLLALDAATGRIVWDEEVFAQSGKTSPGIHSKNSHASPTPVIHGERVYVHFGHQGTACYDLGGKAIWKTQEVKYPPVHGGGCSPIVVGDLLVFSADGAKEEKLVALKLATGEVAWQSIRDINPPKKFAFCTPLAIEVNGKTQIVSPGAGMVGGYDPATGDEIWRVEYDGYSVIPRPVFGHGLVFVSTSYDAPKVLAIRPDGTGNVTDTHVAWQLDRGGPHSPSMVLVGDELYLVSDGGVAMCVDAQTGKKHWQQRLGGNFSSSLLAGDGKIYFQSEDGVGTVVEAATSFNELARNEMKERTLASYAVIGSDLLIRTDKHLYRIRK
jgi:outer membrane protein assembly factor BamB